MTTENNKYEDNFKKFEIMCNKIAINLCKFDGSYTVIERFNPIKEFNECFDCGIKKSYWLYRILDCSMSNAGLKYNYNVFKIITNDIVRYVVIKNPILTSLYNGKVYIGYNLKNELKMEYKYDKIFTVSNDRYISMYENDEKHFNRIKKIFEIEK